jgi:uncharacterized protein (TIGR03067 family)
MYVRVKLNGVPAVLAVDTACYGCLITPNVVRRLGGTPIATGRSLPNLLRGPEAEYVSGLFDLSIGSLAAKKFLFDVQAMNIVLMTSSAQSDGVPVCDGLLGYSFLAHYSAVIDYASNTMYLRQPRSREPLLMGTWESVQVRQDGGTEETSKRPYKLTIGDEMWWEWETGHYACSYLLDAAVSPKILTWQVENKTSGAYPLQHIYKVEGDKLTIAGQLLRRDRPVVGRPKDFTARFGSPYEVITFRRVRERAPAPRPAR